MLTINMGIHLNIILIFFLLILIFIVILKLIHKDKDLFHAMNWKHIIYLSLFVNFESKNVELVYWSPLYSIINTILVNLFFFSYKSIHP